MRMYVLKRPPLFSWRQSMLRHIDNFVLSDFSYIRQLVIIFIVITLRNKNFLPFTFNYRLLIINLDSYRRKTNWGMFFDDVYRNKNANKSTEFQNQWQTILTIWHMVAFYMELTHHWYSTTFQQTPTCQHQRPPSVGMPRHALWRRMANSFCDAPAPPSRWRLFYNN